MAAGAGGAQSAADRAALLGPEARNIARMGDDGKLGLGIKLSYAMPRLACSLFSLHIGSKTRKYYTDGEPGISPSTLAMLVAVLKCGDLFTGMLVGYYSDNCTSKYGRRKPFIGVGAPLWCISVVMLCLAPNLGEPGDSAYAWYFALFYFMFYSVGWSMTVITYDALAMELTTDFDERASLFGYKAMFQMIGYISWSLIAGVFAGIYPNSVKDQIFAPGVAFAVIVAVAFAQMLAIVQEPPRSDEDRKQAADDDDGVVPMVRRMFRNPVYWSYLKFKVPPPPLSDRASLLLTRAGRVLTPVRRRRRWLSRSRTRYWRTMCSTTSAPTTGQGCREWSSRWSSLVPLPTHTHLPLSRCDRAA